LGSSGAPNSSLGEPGTDPVGGAYMHKPSGHIRIRIVVVLGDIEIILDLELP